jgi:hypothetical protein
VAWTCKVAGIENVAVLDGGFTKWARENKSVSTDKPAIREVTYSGRIDRATVASKAYVLRRLKKLIIADNRVPEDYFGITSKPGHIRRCRLPTPWFSTRTDIQAQDLLRPWQPGFWRQKSKEIGTLREVVFRNVVELLTQVLGYRDVCMTGLTRNGSKTRRHQHGHTWIDRSCFRLQKNTKPGTAQYGLGSETCNAKPRADFRSLFLISGQTQAVPGHIKPIRLLEQGNSGA